MNGKRKDPALSRWSIVIFSYNRAEMLKNSIQSALDCADPIQVLVWDDDSDDPKTLEVLDGFRSRGVEVHISKGGNETRGGLYANMGEAMALLLQRGVHYSIFTQDDVQIVRQVALEDLILMENAFSRCSNIAEISVCFKRSTGLPLEYDARCGVYINPNRWHSAVGAFDLKKLQSINWQPSISEEMTDDLTRRAGLVLGVHPYPFMNWLANARTYGAARGLANRLADWWMSYGFYPYRYMTGEEVEALKSRDLGAGAVGPGRLAFLGERPRRPHSYISARRKLKKKGAWRLIILFLTLSERRQRQRVSQKVSRFFKP